MFLFNTSEHLQIVPTCKLLFQTWVTFISHLVHSEINFKPVKLVKNKNNDNNNKKKTNGHIPQELNKFLLFALAGMYP